MYQRSTKPKRLVDIPESYFEGEERCGFYVQPMMKRCWVAQIEVLKEIEQVCTRHQIPFYADWGTMLGAVRHQGFIPWDDDMDIAMKREDYERFWRIARQELPERYQVVNIHTDETFDSMLTRVTNNDQIEWGEDFLEKYHGCPYAVGIDVFPLDYVPRNKDEEELQKEMLTIVFSAINFLEDEESDPKEVDDLIRQIQELCKVQFAENRPLRSQLFELGDQLLGLYTAEHSDYLTSMPDLANGWDYYVPKEAYDSVIQMPYEMVTMPVPVGYDTILKIKYGDYMTPVHGATNHDYPFYKSQEEMLRQFLQENHVSGDRFYL